MNNRYITLIEVLRNADTLGWQMSLFCAGGQNYSSSTTCSVLDDEASADKDSDLDSNLAYTLNIQDLQSVVSNAIEQKPDISDEELVQAFAFYVQNDAFIEL